MTLRDSQALRLSRSSEVTSCQDSAHDRWQYWANRRTLGRRHQYYMVYPSEALHSLNPFFTREVGLKEISGPERDPNASLAFLGMCYISHRHVKILLLTSENSLIKNVFR